MALHELFELREVESKRVFIVDDHHKALAAWAVVRREREDAPILITFDHHTDIYEAFSNAAAMKHPWNHERAEVHRQELAAKLGWATDDQVVWAVERLQHDEHIEAATSCGILRASFSFQLSDMGGWTSLDEAAPNNVFVVGHECFIGCTGRPHTDKCRPRHYSEVPCRRRVGALVQRESTRQAVKVR